MPHDKETLMARPRKKKDEPKYEKDDGPLTDEQLAQLPVQPIQQFEIDWDKIAENVREAALMAETTTTEETKPKRTRKK